MKKYILIALFMLIPILLSATLYVDDDWTLENCGGHTWGVNAFAVIQNAINYVETNLPNGETILVYEGTYEENIVISNNNLRIESRYYITGNEETIQNTIIDGEINNVRNRCVLIQGDYVTIAGLKITNGRAQFGGGICATGEENNSYNSLEVIDCIIEDCISEYPGFYGGGIFIQSYCGTIVNDIRKISNTIFRDCSCYVAGGGLALYNASHFDIDNCQFIDNESDHQGGGAVIAYSNYTNINNCLFTGNLLNDSDFEVGAAIKIHGEESGEGVFIGINKCTIVNNTGDDYPGIYVAIQNNNVEITNSIILDESNLPNIMPNYCNLWTDYGGTNICETDLDEVFVDADNDDYHLTWGTGCIDGGDPNSPEDEDYSPADMGCYPYTQRDVFDTNTKYTWMCYPKLDVSDGENTGVSGYDYQVPGQIWTNYWNVQPSYIKVWHKVSYPVIYGQYIGNQYNWTTGPSYNIYSWKGIKIMSGGKHFIGGYLMDEGVAELYTFEDLPANQESWLGYYLEDSQQPGDAISLDVMDELLSIKTQRWSLNRTSTAIPWMIPASYTINYGDCVVLWPEETIEDFQWQGSQGRHNRQEPIIRPVAEHFEWEEEIDYLPVYVRLDANDLPEEVAIYVNDICKGAQVVEDTITQICAYILEEEAGSEIEFAFYDGERNIRSCKYLVLDNLTGKVTGSKLLTGTPGSYYYVSLTDETSFPPAIKYNLRVAPNPFNPSAAIYFELEEESEIKLSIYNVKGQIVKSLVNETYRPGEYQIIWDGHDQAGQKMSSGVYFYQMQCGNDVITGKMLMLK